MSTAAMPSVFEQILASYNLSIANMRWLGEQFLHQADIKSQAKKKLQPYTMAEINAMLDESEADFAAGRYKTNDQIFHHV